jgi:WhiB family redox-sensing transcriptional regulator
MTRQGDAHIRAYDRPPRRWTRYAACRGMDPEIFHPGKGRPRHAAKAVCATCPVVISCREWALEMRETIGVWGGLSEKERRAIRRLRQAS